MGGLTYQCAKARVMSHPSAHTSGRTASCIPCIVGSTWPSFCREQSVANWYYQKDNIPSHPPCMPALFDKGEITTLPANIHVWGSTLLTVYVRCCSGPVRITYWSRSLRTATAALNRSKCRGMEVTGSSCEVDGKTAACSCPTTRASVTLYDVNMPCAYLEH